jgi:hypothetical protein
MIKFLDGPAAGTILQLKRAPLYLRVVIDPRGTVDALDQLDDTPETKEAVWVYRLVAPANWYHLHCGGRRPNGSGFYQQAEYRLHAEQPTDAVLRRTEAWQTWCYAQPPEYAGPIEQKATEETKGE